MPIAEAIREMEGKIYLLDNKKFLYSAGIVGIYYLSFLGFLAYTLLTTR